MLRWFSRYRADVLTLISFLLLAGCLSVAVGQTAGWDLVNYHLYNAWALLHHRWSHDIFVAGVQTYFDPLIELPYYFLSMVWLPDQPILVAFLAGLPYGALCYLGFWISRDLIGSLTWMWAFERYVGIAVASALAASSVFAWSQLGTATGELPVAVLVMGGIVVLLRASRNDPGRAVGMRSAFVIGILIGAAAGLKLTVAVYAPAMWLVLLFTGPSLREGIRPGVSYLLGWMLAFSALYGFWGVHLYIETGNPFFPMFNNVFHSPFAASISGRDLRFYPDGIVQWLFLPFLWIRNHGLVSNGVMFHEPRLAFFYALTLIFGMVALYRTCSGKEALRFTRLGRVVTFCVLSYVIWIIVFALARYIVVLDMLGSIAGMVMVLMMTRNLQSGFGRVLRVGVMLLLAGLVGCLSKLPRTKRVSYARSVYVSNVPRLARNAMVILASEPMGLPAILISRVNPGTQFIGITHCFANGQPCEFQFYHHRLGKEMRDAINRHQGPLYVSYPMGKNPSMPQLTQFGVKLDPEHCQVMRTNVTHNIKICRAVKFAGGLAAAKLVQQYKLSIDTTILSSSVHVSTQWLNNACGWMTNPGQLRIRWSVGRAERHIRFSVESTDGSHRLLARSSKLSGEITTGNWVNARQTFVISDMHKKALARMAVKYRTCAE